MNTIILDIGYTIICNAIITTFSALPHKSKYIGDAYYNGTKHKNGHYSVYVVYGEHDDDIDTDTFYAILQTPYKGYSIEYNYDNI